MKEIFKYIILVAVAAVMWSCDDDLGIVDKGDTITFTIDASATFSDTDSRAVFADGDEKNITKYCLLVYDGTSNSSKLIESVDITSLPTTLTLPSPGAGNYRAIMIANSQLSELKTYATKDSSTLDDLNNATFPVSSHYNIPGGGSDPDDYAPAGAATNFTWSGYVDYTGSTRSMFFNLRPNMAKLTVTVSNKCTEGKEKPNPIDQIKIVNIQIKNVRNKVLHAQNALSDAELYRKPSEFGFTNYNIEKLELAPGESKTRHYYIPHNLGDTYADATYIEVDGVRQLDFMDTAYKLYISSSASGNYNSNNYTSDYKVRCDHKYNVNITITNDGLYYDSSVVNKPTEVNSTEAQKVILPKGTNCYMIHPKISRSDNGIVYQLPVDRVNEYWGNNTISDNTEWNMVVIWQDMPNRSIHFTNEQGTTKTDYYHGKGNNPAYFKLADEYKNISASTSPTHLNNYYGNIVVGLTFDTKDNSKNDDTYKFMWSWHLWITDYNPDGAIKPSEAETYYNDESVNSLFLQETGLNDDFHVDVQGYYFTNSTAFRPHGNVQHYYHADPDCWSTQSDNVWKTTYKDKWIMDRNLGSKGPTNIDMANATDAYGLYYQYGRKDPFSFKNTYFINGSSRAISNKKYSIVQANGTAYNNSIYYPNNYYTNDSGSWTSENRTNAWYSPTAPAKKGAKTIFDPCPAGWTLPLYDVFDFARLTNGVATSGGEQFYEASAYDNYNTQMNHFVIYCDYTAISGGTYNVAQRHMAVLTSLKYIKTKGKYYTLATAIPMQAEISTSGGIVSYTNDYTDAAFMWVAGCNSGLGESLRIAGTKWISTYADGRAGSGRYARKAKGGLSLSNLYASRGQPVRCIQEPD